MIPLPSSGMVANKQQIRESYLLARRALDGEVSVEFFKDHFKFGSLIDDPSLEGRTILMMAAYQGNLDLVKAALDKGASPDISNQHGTTALMAAATKGHSQVVKTLTSCCLKLLQRFEKRPAGHWDNAISMCNW